MNHSIFSKTWLIIHDNKLRLVQETVSEKALIYSFWSLPKLFFCCHIINYLSPTFDVIYEQPLIRLLYVKNARKLILLGRLFCNKKIFARKNDFQSLKPKMQFLHLGFYDQAGMNAADKILWEKSVWASVCVCMCVREREREREGERHFKWFDICEPLF